MQAENIAVTQPGRGATPLHLLVSGFPKEPISLSAAAVAKLLASRYAVNQHDDRGSTALHLLAARPGSENDLMATWKLGKALLELGAEPDAVDARGLTPLHLCAEAGPHAAPIANLLLTSAPAGRGPPARPRKALREDAATPLMLAMRRGGMLGPGTSKADLLAVLGSTAILLVAASIRHELREVRYNFLF